LRLIDHGVAGNPDGGADAVYHIIPAYRFHGAVQHVYPAARREQDDDLWGRSLRLRLQSIVACPWSLWGLCAISWSIGRVFSLGFAQSSGRSSRAANLHCSASPCSCNPRWRRLSGLNGPLRSDFGPPRSTYLRPPVAMPGFRVVTRQLPPALSDRTAPFGLLGAGLSSVTRIAIAALAAIGSAGNWSSSSRNYLFPGPIWTERIPLRQPLSASICSHLLSSLCLKQCFIFVLLAGCADRALVYWACRPDRLCPRNGALVSVAARHNGPFCLGIFFAIAAWSFLGSTRPLLSSSTATTGVVVGRGATPTCISVLPILAALVALSCAAAKSALGLLLQCAARSARLRSASHLRFGTAWLIAAARRRTFFSAFS